MENPPVEELLIWEGSPSQWLNFKTFALSGLAAMAISVAAVALSAQSQGQETLLLGGTAVLLMVPAYVAVRRYLDTRFTRYRVTSERFRVTRGILSRHTDDTELYRVDDSRVVEPFLLRLVGRGTIVLVTSDRTTPDVLIDGVPNVTELRDRIRKYVEICRDRKKTRVLDFQ